MHIEYEVIAPDGSIQHTSRFNVYVTDERRAFLDPSLTGARHD